MIPLFSALSKVFCCFLLMFVVFSFFFEIITLFQQRQKRHFAPIIGAATYLGAVAHDIVGQIENPFRDTFRDRYGNINIHGDRDTDAYLNAHCDGNCRMGTDVRGDVHGRYYHQQNVDSDVGLGGNVHSNAHAHANGGLNLNLHLGFRRAGDNEFGHNIFVPIDDVNAIENFNRFGNTKRYAVFCKRFNVYG